MRRHLVKNDLDHWASSFFDARCQAAGQASARDTGRPRRRASPAAGRRRPLLIASDYDGVLAPLADDPSAAVPQPGVAEALARLAGRRRA